VNSGALWIVRRTIGLMSAFDPLRTLASQRLLLPGSYRIDGSWMIGSRTAADSALAVD
jgi:hypothetical protein